MDAGILRTSSLQPNVTGPCVWEPYLTYSLLGGAEGALGPLRMGLCDSALGLGTQPERTGGKVFSSGHQVTTSSELLIS